MEVVLSNTPYELLDRGANVRTSGHKTPLKIQDDRIEVLENELTKLDDAMKLVEVLIRYTLWIHWTPKFNSNRLSNRTKSNQCNYKCIGLVINKRSRFLDLNSSTGY